MAALEEVVSAQHAIRKEITHIDAGLLAGKSSPLPTEPHTTLVSDGEDILLAGNGCKCVSPPCFEGCRNALYMSRFATM
jgi:hypothetical protein